MILKSKTRLLKISSNTVHSLESTLLNVDYTNMTISFKDNALDILERRHKSPLIKFLKEAYLNEEDIINIEKLDAIENDINTIDFTNLYQIIKNFSLYTNKNNISNINENDIILYIGIIAIKENKE